MSAEHEDLLFLSNQAVMQESDNLDVKAKIDTASVELESAIEPFKPRMVAQVRISEDEIEDLNSGTTEGFGDVIRGICARFDNPYNSSAEENPRCSSYSPVFAEVEQMYRDLVEEAVNLFVTSEWTDSETKRLVKKLLALKEPKYPAAKRIVLIGDSGAGNFSYLSSLED